MEQICNFFALRKQQAVFPGDGSEHDGGKHLDDHANAQRNTAGDDPAHRG